MSFTLLSTIQIKTLLQLIRDFGRSASHGVLGFWGFGPIHMDLVDCEGDEKELTWCRFSGLGDYYCSHSEDAGVMCNGERKLGDYICPYLKLVELTLQT